ncbi:Cytochrome b5 [Akanthomyces lecanii RCEF 1005]|uniref:Cytochrome b5 n=1 Tax=Akanthomyces lecanii RCEF 1005 TaxID=1081108 RepID=A0A162KLY0_CORDF|nr:Cytochrome b5 [Akanthomyces lecanii RCEF 1005]
MGLIGLSLIVASVVYVIIRPPSWLPPTLLAWLQRSAITPAITDARRRDADNEKDDAKNIQSSPPRPTPTIVEPRDADRVATPPPPLPPPLLTTTLVQPPSIAVEHDDELDESPTTPKATAVQPSMPPPPSFSLSTGSMPPPPRPTPNPSSASSMMPPPPLPSRLSAAPRPPVLSQFPAANSAQRARGPVPNRGPPSSGGGGLAPPPTHTSIPAKPSRQVTLDPGHSPLDWARISGGPNADLRGVPASTPYLRVTPSMLRRQTGRKGKDAWMALNGKVYNVTPYAKFHPGGVPELMRGAARDGTRLFGEVHPWVNYENMLTACLVGILVDEPEPTAAVQPQSDMEAMD